MRIPIVLSVVHVDIDPDGTLHIAIDGNPYDPGHDLARKDLRSVIAEIVNELGAPVRIDVREADGTTYSDIETPTEARDLPAPALEERTPTPPALAGAGFHPGEHVALAYVISRHTADAGGNAAINLPPALIANARDGLVLLGLTSQVITPIAAPIETPLEAPA